MKVILQMDRKQAKEYIPMLMDHVMKENGAMMIKMELELSNFQMEMFIKDNLLMVKETDQVFISMQTEISMTVSIFVLHKNKKL